MGLAAEIVKRREALGWSQNALARRADVQQPTLQRIEAGKTADPNVSIVVALARALGASVEELVGDEARRPTFPPAARSDDRLAALEAQVGEIAVRQAEGLETVTELTRQVRQLERLVQDAGIAPQSAGGRPGRRRRAGGGGAA